MYMGPKGSFEPPVSEPKLKVEPIKIIVSQGDDLEKSAARALMRHVGRGRGGRGEGRR